MISGVENPDRLTRGADVSRWEPADQVDYLAIRGSEIKFMAIRCTVGNYYSDSHFSAHWDGAFEAGLLRMPYLVVAPAAYDGGPQISTNQHIDYFMKAFGDREAELPWVLDCELTRKQTRSYITDLIGGIVEACHAYLGRYPIIYTRQTWWDPNTYADSLWPKCPLWVARYSSLIQGPWSDGYCKFRDWQSWHFWQWTDHGSLPGYSGGCDLDYFNGDLPDLLMFSGNLTITEMVKILWREAEIEGWNLER